MKRHLRILALTLVCALLALMAVGCSNSNPSSSSTPGSSGSDAPQSNAADSWPSQPISIIAGGKAGGDTDFNGRAYTKYLTEALGQSVVVVNVDGGGGSIAAMQVYEAKPDGYTVLVTHLSHACSMATGALDVGYRDYEMIGAVGTSAGDILCVRAGEYTDLNDLVAKTKAAPGTIVLGVNTGSTTYAEAAALSEAANVTFNYVDAGGAADKAVALLGGHIDIAMLPYGTAKSYLESGDFVGLAVATEQRNDRFPDIPTYVEMGYDVVVPTTYCFMMPKGTPQEIVDKFAAACKEIALNNADYAADLDASFGQDPFWMDADDALAFYDEMVDLMAKYCTGN